MATPDLSKAMEQIAKANPALFYSLRPKWTRFIPHEPTPKQLAFLCLPHREAFYGGAVGGGKSDALLMAALQYVDVPGYAAMIFRKTLSDLKQPGALLDRTHSWLANSDAKWVAGEHTYYFPTVTLQGEPGEPAKLTFGYIGNVDAYVRYQGIELQYCVAPDTPVLMADGSTAPIHTVRPGDLVATLCGPRPVTRTHRVRKPAVALLTPYAWQIQSTTHRIWSLPDQTNACTSRQSLLPGRSVSQTGMPNRTSSPCPGTRSQDPSHAFGQWQSFQCLSSQGSYAYRGSPELGTCSEWFDGGSLALQPQLTATLGASPAAPPPALSAGPYFRAPHHGTACDQQMSQVPDCWGSCSPYLHQYGELRAQTGLDLPADPRTLGRVETLLVGVPSTTPTRNPEETSTLLHPYTRKPLGHLPVHWFEALLVPLSQSLDMCDLTVAGASHYITCPSISQPSHLIVNSNCAFDELTQHWEDDYTYMFSRLRRNKCPTHGKDVDKDCPDCSQRSQVPIRMRSASNPGNVGHAWVMERFNIGEAPDPNNPGHTRYVGRNPKRPYIPAYLQDNPFLDSEEYEHGLAELDPVTRQQLRKGDWGVSADSRFRKGWARYYSRRADNYVLGKDGRGPVHPYSSLVRVFATVDPAASAREGPGDSDIWRKAPSWTVISLWGVTTDYNLLWLDLIRFRKEIPDILDELKKAYRKWRPQYFAIEASGLGKGVFQMTAKAGLPTKAVYPHGDKLVRATDAMNRMEQGRIWLPQSAGWLDALEKELFTWTGHPQQQDDQIDTLAYAAMDVSWEAAHGEVQEHIGYLPDDMLPGIIV